MTTLTMFPRFKVISLRLMSIKRPPPPGCAVRDHLSESHAISLLPGAVHVLRAKHQCRFLQVTHGTVWATTGGGPHDPQSPGADHQLVAGQRLLVGRGQRVVLESISATASARYRWV